MLIKQTYGQGVPGEVSFSLPISRYMAIVFRVQFLDEGRGLIPSRARRKAPSGESDLKTIRRFKEGLEKGRLEFHGNFFSDLTANLLAHLRDFDDDAEHAQGFECYREDVDTFGVDDEKLEWSLMSMEARVRVISEAKAIGTIASLAWDDITQHWDQEHQEPQGE